MDEQPKPNRTGKVLAMFLAVFLLAAAGFTVWIVVGNFLARGWFSF